MNKYKCPECDAIIDYLKYAQDVTEYGDYTLPEEPNNKDDAYEGNYDSNDSSGGDNTTYNCPECDCEICLSDLIIVDDNDEEVGNNDKTKKKNEDNTKVIAPSSSHAENFNPWDESAIPDHVVCKKCKRVILISEDEKDDEAEISCPKCNTQIIIKIK